MLERNGGGKLIEVAYCAREGRRLQMIPIAAVRRLGRWLAALYVVAQICGVVPLMSCHSAHAGADPLVLSECTSGARAVPQGHHHAGDADDAADHHVLQDLNGVLGFSVDCCEVVWVHIVTPAATQRALVEADPIVLERPPKSFLSI